jgi:hypothetical protein
MMAVVTSKEVRGGRRAVMQEAKLAIRTVYDAVIELFTNADDRYQILCKAGTIELEVERHRGGSPSIIRVRDRADGMTDNIMDEKLSTTGGRVSGMESGEDVRGTCSRGAKHLAALGRVIFESIADDGQYHCCEITPHFVFKLKESKPVTPRIRKRLGIEAGTGTLVTIEVDPINKVPQHDTLCDRVGHLVALRDILADRNRVIVVRNLAQNREDVVTAPIVEGRERVKERFEVPGYPGAVAKLVIKRATRPFDRAPDQFRLGGLLVKSRHAIHEATLFDASLEADPHAAWFYGKVACEYIDELWNAFDDRFEAEEAQDPSNPHPVIDPLRRTGLDSGHPFAKALSGEVLKRLRPLVEEERQRAEKERATVESTATRRRLDALEKAAIKFMEEFGDPDEPVREPDSKQTESRFVERGYSLSPPFAQMVVGHSQRFWLNVSQEAYPELKVGTTVQIECLSSDVAASKRFCGLDAHPTRDGVLRAIWKVTANSATPATGVRVQVGSITAESIVEVFQSEADKYTDVKSLTFRKKRFTVKTGAKKKVRVFAPLTLVASATAIDVSVSGRHFSIAGEKVIRPDSRLGVAICELTVKSDGTEDRATITASLGSLSTSAEIASVRPAGEGLKIKLEDIDLGNQRYRWRKNVLEIAARHPSLSRYLGPSSSGFPGQESPHFRLLLAEIVADAVCAQMVSRNVQRSPEDYEDADWDLYYAEYTKRMTRFLPIAHKLQYPDVTVNGSGSKKA